MVATKKVIFLDTNIFVIDLRYPRDPLHSVNRAFLEKVKTEKNGKTTVISLLELCGILSFNLNRQQLDGLFRYFPAKYSVSLFPANYLGLESLRVQIGRIFEIVSRKLSFGDALQLLYVESHLPIASAFITWDAEHFNGKSIIPVLTPGDYLKQPNS